MYDHLNLNFVQQSFERAKRQGFGKRIQRNPEQKREFFNTSIQQFQNFENDLTALKEKYAEYVDPNLIFKIEMTQKESEESFTNELIKLGISVLYTVPDKKGYWVVFANDRTLQAFKRKLESYKDENRYDFFNSIKQLNHIPIQEKLGTLINEHPLTENRYEYIDVEIWRMEDEELHRFLRGFKTLIINCNGRITDKLIKDSFCLLRIYADKHLFDKIKELKEIRFIDRPPKPYIDFTYLSMPLENLEVIPESDLLNKSAIAVLDTGIVSNHPLFKDAVGTELPDSKGNIGDDVGHGTGVAGIALYGDIKKAIDDSVFKQEVMILSAKIMYAEYDAQGNPAPKYDEEKLIEHQLEDVVNLICQNYPQCRVFNLSFGNLNHKMFNSRKQFNLALTVDELAKRHNIIFTISTGNYSEFDLDDYPNYLLNETEDVKIIDPASSALALTVGSVAQDYGPFLRYPDDISFSPAQKDFPSPFTRAGLGFRGMIKPDLVETGGNIILDRTTRMENLGGKIVTLNRNFLNDGRLFTVDRGTSYSAPLVANHLAKLINKYPTFSKNMIKALLLSSAKIPNQRPSPLDEIQLNASNENLSNILKIYGYGKPCVDESLYSLDDNVLLIKENKIFLNNIHLYSFYLPESFFTQKGDRMISVTLVFDPKVNKNRMDYLGCSMSFWMFRNLEIEEIRKNFSKIKVENINEDDSAGLKIDSKYKIELKPTPTLRSKGVHQKGWIRYSRSPGINKDKPIVLAVMCQNKWIKDIHYQQDYAVIVKIEHHQNLELYNELRLRNMVRVQVRR